MHDHSHHHHGGNLRTAFFLNAGFALFELIGGMWTGSLAIVSDALHDLGDSISLGLAWYLDRVSHRRGDQSFSYGYRRFSLLGALINTLILILGGGLVLWRAIPALWAPELPNARGMVMFAVVGMAVNGFATLKLWRQEGLNARTAALHLLEDALGWAAVLLVSIVLLFVDWPILDPLLSVLITAYVLVRAVAALVKTMKLFLQAVPEELDLAPLEASLREITGVRDAHHLHVWSLDGEQHVMSAHLLVDEDISREAALHIKQAARRILQLEGVQHLTVEIEYGENDCSMNGCGPDDAHDHDHTHHHQH